MKRLFCSIGVPANREILEAVDSWKQNFAGQNVKWVNPNDYHVTLKFLGETEETKMLEIIKALENCAPKLVPFSFHVQNGGTFRKNNVPSVIWLDLLNTSGLVFLYNTINKALRHLDYATHKTCFVPHLTIGRIKQANDTKETQALMNRIITKQLATVRVDSFSLMESILQAQGPKYSVVGKFLFKSGSND